MSLRQGPLFRSFPRSRPWCNIYLKWSQILIFWHRFNFPSWPLLKCDSDEFTLNHLQGHLGTHCSVYTNLTLAPILRDVKCHNLPISSNVYRAQLIFIKKGIQIAVQTVVARPQTGPTPIWRGSVLTVFPIQRLSFQLLTAPGKVEVFCSQRQA